MCKYCSQMKEWAEGKVSISLDAELCNDLVNRMLLLQIRSLTIAIKEQLSFQKEMSKKSETWITKMFGWLKRAEEETNEGEEWKK